MPRSLMLASDRKNKVENIVTIRKGSKEVSGSRLKKTGVPEAVFYCPFVS